MTDILIKSFNRPYYLERCLSSIDQYVRGSFTIKVIDDGTPEKYLNRLTESHPEIKIYKSENYKKKIDAIKQHLNGVTPYHLEDIPVKLWKECVESSSEYFLLLEEDNWFTTPFEIDQFASQMANHQLCIVKLGWNGNMNTVTGKKVAIDDSIERIIPQLPIKSDFIISPYFKNTFKVRSIFNRLGYRLSLPYYTMYATSCAIFHKKYWLELWKDSSNKIDEHRQLLNALKYYNSDQRMAFGKAKDEIISTSFITASTNRFQVANSDMIQINHHLNEAWFAGQLNVNEGIPMDFSIDYLEQIIEHSNPKLIVGWEKWRNFFNRIHHQSIN